MTSSPHRRPRWKSYLLLGRVSNLPTVWTNCLAASLLVRPDLDWFSVGAGLIALSLFYIGGMLLNDAFDHRFDSQYRSERPIPAGDISLKEVFVAGFGLLFVAEVALVAPDFLLGRGVDFEVLAWGAVMALLIVYYNYRHKSDPLSPVVMALCRVMVYMTAGALALTSLDGPPLPAALLLAAYLIGLTYVAKQENLASIGSSWPVAFIAIPFLYHLTQFGMTRVGAVLWIGFLAWVLYSLSFVYRKQGRSIPRTVVGLIAGISLLDGLAIASTGAPAVFVGLAVAGFFLTLAFQRFVPGT